MQSRFPIYIAGRSADDQLAFQFAERHLPEYAIDTSTWYRHNASVLEAMDPTELWERCLQEMQAARLCVVLPPMGPSKRPESGSVFEAGWFVARGIPVWACPSVRAKHSHWRTAPGVRLFKDLYDLMEALAVVTEDSLVLDKAAQ